MKNWQTVPVTFSAKVAWTPKSQSSSWLKMSTELLEKSKKKKDTKEAHKSTQYKNGKGNWGETVHFPLAFTHSQMPKIDYSLNKNCDGPIFFQIYHRYNHLTSCAYGP